MFRNAIRQVQQAETINTTGKIENIVGMSIEASGAKAATLSFIRGREAREMDALGRAFLRDYVPRRCFPGARAELDRLRAEGFRVVVVTASAEVYMRLLPEFLPVDEVIATRCAIDWQGRYTGAVGANCKGEEKPRRIREWLDARRLPEPDWAACRAYGDSPSDAPMLGMVGQPVLVDPRRSLRARLPGAPVARWR